MRRAADRIARICAQPVTRVVLQGTSTTQTAAELAVSAHTVQQCLRAIFDKTGVHSRRDLVGRECASAFVASHEVEDSGLRNPGEPWGGSGG